MSEGIVEAGGGARLRFSVEGDGPSVLLVHAGACDMRMWDGVVERLAPDHRCIRFDMRGYGLTEYPDTGYSPAGDVEQVLEALDCDDVTVVGASYGGLVAIEHALAHPRRVARLVLLDALLGDHDFSEQMREFAAAEERALEEGRLEDAVELNVAMWAPDAPADVQALLRDMQRRAFELQLDCEPEPVWLHPPAGERLHELDLPVDVVHGERDTADFVAIARRLADELPDAQLHVIEACGHLPALERPDAVADLIAEG